MATEESRTNRPQCDNTGFTRTLPGPEDDDDDEEDPTLASGNCMIRTLRPILVRLLSKINNIDDVWSERVR